MIKRPMQRAHTEKPAHVQNLDCPDARGTLILPLIGRNRVEVERREIRRRHFSTASAAIAALSVHSASGGMNSSAPFRCRHRLQRGSQAPIRRDAAADREALQARLAAAPAAHLATSTSTTAS